MHSHDDTVNNFLSALAKTYDVYIRVSPQRWVEDRRMLDGGPFGGFIIDSCIYNAAVPSTINSSENINKIISIIAIGLFAEEKSELHTNAMKACTMFAELYKRDPSIRTSFDRALINDPLAIEQIKSGNFKDAIMAKLEFDRTMSMKVPEQEQKRIR